MKDNKKIMLLNKTSYRNISSLLLFLLIIIGSVACKKYLDAKPNKSLVVPSSLKDLQALLDNDGIMNGGYRTLPVVADDDIYLPSHIWANASIEDRRAYIWDKDVNYNAWNSLYRVVHYANIVLQELSKFRTDDSYDNIRGQALFFRSFAFYHLAQLYCRPFSMSAPSDLGIVLRVVPDIEEKSVRSTVQQTYAMVITDLKEAVTLLPENNNNKINRPNKAAAFGVLARVYLSMSDYVNAGIYADLYLKRYNNLIDFNTLSTTINPPISQFNPETIFYAVLNGISIPNGVTQIDTLLYKSYNDNDLRKSIYFLPDGSGGYSFKGGYAGGLGWIPFCGIATDEMFLTRAECSARQGLKDSALSDLNILMKNRWKNNGSFVPFTAADANVAKNIILAERRKELIFRGTRWSDLRRLNLEGANITLNRIINGTTHTLLPNELRWVWLIPQDVINLTNMQQNPR